jgi:hypothetical protein
MSMSNTPDENSTDDWEKSPQDSRLASRGRRRMLVQGSEAQKAAARSIEKNARLMVWTVALAAVSTVISAAGLVFVVVYLLRTLH